jgi:hypothetical protein
MKTSGGSMEKKPAKKQKKSAKSDKSRFRIRYVGWESQNCSTDAPDGVLELFQKECKSREQLLEFLIEYSIKHEYFGLGKASGFDNSLEVYFVDVDGVEYSVEMVLHPFLNMCRFESIGGDSNDSIELPYWGPFEGALLNWKGDTATDKK